MRRSEERFRTIFEQAPLGISEGEIATARFINANQRYVDILGYTFDELRKLTFKDYTHPDDLQKDLVEFQKLATGEIGTYAMEKRYLRKDGAIIWVNLTVTGLARPGEKPRNCIAVIEDITERKRAAEQLEEANRQLRILSRQLFHMQEEERRHLARELHDEIGQTLTAAKINLKIIATDVEVFDDVLARDLHLQHEWLGDRSGRANDLFPGGPGSDYQYHPALWCEECGRRVTA